MKIEPKTGPSILNPPTAQANPNGSARERAIAKVLQGNTQTTPVKDPTNVSVEELSAIGTKASENNINETAQSSSPEVAKATETVKEEPLSTQYANLARQEKALRAKVQSAQQAARTKEAELTAREEALKAKEAEYLTNYIPKARFKQDPLAVLTEEGVSYDEITKAILNPQAQQDPRIMAELEKMRAELQDQRRQQAEAKQAAEAQQQQAYKQAVAEIRASTQALVASNPDFETIKETQSVNDVVDLIEKTYHKDGILLSVEDAAKEVEEYLVEEALKLARLTKVKTRLQGSSSEAKPAQTQQVSGGSQKQQATPTMKTLTSSVNAPKHLSARERAIAAFKGEKL